jgi:plasmid stability protein
VAWGNRAVLTSFFQFASNTGKFTCERRMAVVTVRNLPDETHRALKLRAARHGRSTEAEIRDILEKAVAPEKQLKLGSALKAFGERFGGLELDIARDPTPSKPITFE